MKPPPDSLHAIRRTGLPRIDFLLGRPRLSGWRRDRRGVTAVEFALLAPVVFLLLLGIMETGRAYWISNTLQHGADEASRFVMVNQDAPADEVTGYALDRLPGLDPDRVTVDVDRETVDGVDFITVQMSYDFTVGAAIIPIPPVTFVGSARAALP